MSEILNRGKSATTRKFSKTMKELGQISFIYGKLIAVVTGGAIFGAAVIAGAWLMGPIVAAVLVGLPLWFAWNTLAPIYITDLSPALTNVSYFHVALMVASVVLLKRLMLSKNTVQISKDKK